MAPFAEARDHLDTITGVGKRAAECIIAEIGADMGRFPTAGHLASWAGMAPGNNITGGKRHSGKTTKGNLWLADILNQCAWSAARSRNTYLSAQFWRLARRIGKKKSRRRGRPLHPGHRLAPAHQRRHLRRPRRRLLRPTRRHRPPPRAPRPTTPRPRLPSHPPQSGMNPSRPTHGFILLIARRFAHRQGRCVAKPRFLRLCRCAGPLSRKEGQARAEVEVCGSGREGARSGGYAPGRAAGAVLVSVCLAALLRRLEPGGPGAGRRPRASSFVKVWSPHLARRRPSRRPVFAQCRRPGRCARRRGRGPGGVRLRLLAGRRADGPRVAGEHGGSAGGLDTVGGPAGRQTRATTSFSSGPATPPPPTRVATKPSTPTGPGAGTWPSRTRPATARPGPRRR